LIWPHSPPHYIATLHRALQDLAFEGELDSAIIAGSIERQTVAPEVSCLLLPPSLCLALRSLVAIAKASETETFRD
jgi:hypothetical protein